MPSKNGKMETRIVSMSALQNIYSKHRIYVGLYTHIYTYIHIRVCLSAEGAKNVSWPWLSPLRGWGSLTMASTGKFVYMAHHFIMLNPFGLRVDREGWWFEHSVS